MACVVSFKIVDSGGADAAGALFSVRAVSSIDAITGAVQFNQPIALVADGSGEGIVTLLPGQYTGVTQIGELLEGSKARTFSFRVPDGFASANLWELVDATPIDGAEFLSLSAWAAAITAASAETVWSSATLGLAGTSPGDYYLVVVSQSGPQLQLWKNNAGVAQIVAPQIGDLDV
jgi:hypothetical protein